MAKQRSLTSATLVRGVEELAASDPFFGRIVAELGAPPMWARRPGFPSLLHIILEQQVSLASARATFEKLRAIASPLTPGRFLQLGDTTLRSVGFSRQKTAYGRNLAMAVLSGNLDLTRLGTLDDNAARAELIKVKGIGSWTADIYLLMALRRPDVWPCGDLALAAATRRALRLPSLPSPVELDAIGLRWRPWRAVAARILWHLYLAGAANGG